MKNCKDVVLKKGICLFSIISVAVVGCSGASSMNGLPPENKTTWFDSNVSEFKSNIKESECCVEPIKLTGEIGNAFKFAERALEEASENINSYANLGYEEKLLVDFDSALKSLDDVTDTKQEGEFQSMKKEIIMKLFSNGKIVADRESAVDKSLQEYQKTLEDLEKKITTLYQSQTVFDIQ